MAHVMRSAARLDVICEVEGGAKQQQSHIVVGCELIVVFMHYDFTDGTRLGVRPRCRKHIKSHNHLEIIIAEKSEKN